MKLYNHDIVLWIHFYCYQCGHEYKIQVATNNNQLVVTPTLINNTIRSHGHRIVTKEGDQYGECKHCRAKLQLPDSDKDVGQSQSDA